ncbi:hypothetical protein ACPV3P_05390 [Photobacterium damselae]|uniref:hypothetical protein n=1 Tax=Photobacterium damselae TaxID=38293 RepID=UPI00406902CC
MSNYQAPPANLKGTTSSALVMYSSEGTFRKTVAKLLLTTVALTMSGPSTATQNETSRSYYAKTLSSSQVFTSWGEESTDKLKSANAKELAPEKSLRLQNTFGFKTAQWAAILQLERKTLYNWKKHPETVVQKRTQERIETLASFAEEIDEGHQRFISKISFGRYSEPSLREALVSQNLNLNNLIEAYDYLYAKLDGHYKRGKHRKGLA